MADGLSPDGIPHWLTALATLITTVAGVKAWGPLGRWVGRRVETAQQIRAAERGDLIAQLTTELRATREENVQLRHELAEERELRMTFAQDYAVLKRDVEHLTKALAEDKRDCQREIRRLSGEVRRLQTEIDNLRQHPNGEPLP